MDEPGLGDRLVECGEAALELDLLDDFERVRSRLEKLSPEHARRLGSALSRPRFLLRGLGGLDGAYLGAFAEVLDAILDAYDAVFGFEEWSKVPGKKLRVRVHLEEKITRSPHFAPQFPFCSKIDFPVVDPKALRSPTADGKFLFYGLCHELGHVIAMWGDRDREEDHLAWAHYTGAAIVEHLSEAAKDRPFMAGLKDVRWRSLSKERERLTAAKPSLQDRDGVLALLIALHDRAGAKAIGAAINHLDRQGKSLRVNRVHYYTFRELEAALCAMLKDPAARKAAAALIPDGPK
ncbi:MAG: hypothetical protein HY721_01240 [Planctomycetes bacterium]|nr:hypothetical protein [Planctomycetota bacterium]